MVRIIALFGLVLSFTVAGAQRIELDSFVAHQKNDQIRLTWTLRSGFICNGIEIQRSAKPEDDFEYVGDIQGVCGSPVENVTYRFTDQPLPGFGRYYYRLKLGLQGFSDVISIHYLNYRSDCYSVFPNPVSKHSRIQLCDEAVGKGALSIYDASGNIVQEHSWNADKSDIGSITGQLAPGLYFFNWNGNVRIRGRFVVSE